MSDPLPEHYFDKYFHSDKPISHWPIHFAIIGYPTSSGDDRATKSEDELEDDLNHNFSWVRRLSSSDHHLEPSHTCWAVNADWHQACELGISLGQEIIYYVSDNTLSVTFCDERRKPYVVDGFLKRFGVLKDK